MKPIHASLTFLGLSFCLLISFVCFGQAGQVNQIIKLSDRYNNVQEKGAPQPKKIVLKNPNEFILDCSGYDFNQIRQMNKGKNPDFLFIISKAGKYKIALNVKGKTIIDSSTMISLDENGTHFQGFDKNDTPMIIIGALKPGTSEMLAYWVGMIQII